MPVIRRFASCLVRINIRDHAPPHFHVVMNDGRDAWVRIDATQIVYGKITAREIAEVLEWAYANRSILAAKFQELQQ